MQQGNMFTCEYFYQILTWTSKHQGDRASPGGKSAFQL